MLVGTLLTLLTLGVLQFGLAVYVRNVVHDAAVEGAHHAALADTSLEEGAARTREIVGRTVGAEYAADVQVRETSALGHPAVEISVRATLPLVGLLGVPRLMEVTAHAPVESFELMPARPERGSAALEFILVGMLLLVPLVYLIVSLGLIQGQSLGAEAGARHIARALSTAESPDARAPERRP